MGFRFDDDSRSGPAPHSAARELASFAAQRSLKRELLGRQREGWAGGHPERAEALLGRWPGDAESDPDAASLLLEDYLQRRRRGEDLSPEDYVRSFPAQSASFRRLIAADTVCRSLGRESQGAPLPLRLPGTGDEVFGFRLGQPLGEGAFARVFLAEQRDLAGRPVVLKVTDVEGSEPQTLAQLLHANIVPIYSLHEDRRAGLRAVCMPYLGGASLSTVLARLWADTNRPAAGEQLVHALHAVEAPRPAAITLAREAQPENPPANAPMALGPDDDDAAIPLMKLRSLSFEQTAAWIVAQLAEGLHHAHERGILHRDIKPSNILIAADGQPLLLDFNLARSGDEDPAHATIGGTVAYMSPEHLRALVGRTSALIRQVDRRSDIYSLGMVLAEMLTGHRPFEQSGSYSAIPLQIEAMALERSKTVPSVRRVRPDLSWGMESIVRKCLAAEPTERYQRADHVADDLRRLIEDRPLRHAPELSRVEAARKFARRHPRLASAGTVVGAATLVVLAVVAALVAARSRLAAAESRELVRAHDAGVMRALCLINTQLELSDNLRDGITACEQTLALLGDPGSPDGSSDPTWDRLAPADRRRLAEDRRELLLLLADARVRLAGASPQAAAPALRLLDRAEAIPGLPESRALWLDRARYLAIVGDSARAGECRRHAQSIPTATARDHYLIATAMARQGGPDRLRAAIAELNEALRINPRHYWSLLQRGICRLDRGELAEAAGDFGQCTGLWPDFAWGYFNLGCALDRSGGKAAAILDYSAAIELDPSLAPAHVNRGLARLELRRDAEALADFDRAFELGAQNASISA
ncbi:MAG: protein kinase domain-containing protein, partial [Isosphaeraceae bacterium]